MTSCSRGPADHRHVPRLIWAEDGGDNENRRRSDCRIATMPMCFVTLDELSSPNFDKEVVFLRLAEEEQNEIGHYEAMKLSTQAFR